MNLLIIGYGKMGQEIEKLALLADHKIVGKIAIENKEELSEFNHSNTDVAIEFSNPDAAFDNLKYCLSQGIPIVSGTTGWLDKKSEIEELCNSHNGTFFYASNFSIGVNIFFELNKRLASLMKAQKEYNTSIEEIHHTQKLDAPSGTAITLAEGVIEHTAYNQWALEGSDDKTIQITAVREDPAPGTHTVSYESSIDSIEIKHTAHSRKGFAQGALMVAEWVKDKKGILTMEQFLKETN